MIKQFSDWLGSKSGLRTLVVLLAVALVISVAGQLFGWWPGAEPDLTGTGIRADREDPLVAFKFGLEVEGKLAGFFTEVNGIGSETEVVSHEITNPETGETIIEMLPGRLTWTEVTLVRGITSNVDLWDWRQSVVDGNMDEARTNCSIIAYSQDNSEIARWNLENAWRE